MKHKRENGAVKHRKAHKIGLQLQLISMQEGEQNFNMIETATY